MRSKGVLSPINDARRSLSEIEGCARRSTAIPSTVHRRVSSLSNERCTPRQSNSVLDERRSLHARQSKGVSRSLMHRDQRCTAIEGCALSGDPINGNQSVRLSAIEILINRRVCRARRLKGVLAPLMHGNQRVRRQGAAIPSTAIKGCVAIKGLSLHTSTLTNQRACLDARRRAYLSPMNDGDQRCTVILGCGDRRACSLSLSPMQSKGVCLSPYRSIEILINRRVCIECIPARRSY